jgi:hypothetical protein
MWQISVGLSHILVIQWVSFWKARRNCHGNVGENLCPIVIQASLDSSFLTRRNTFNLDKMGWML